MIHDQFQAIRRNDEVPIWQCKEPATYWDDMNTVGTRNAFLCAVQAARMMVAQKSGLIVNLGSAGGAHSLYGPCYGAHKAAVIVNVVVVGRRRRRRHHHHPSRHDDDLHPHRHRRRLVTLREFFTGR